ncbi:MAG: AAA family ATPase [Chloroflexi bacterium]|nr:AAA family ATPase [Chloroflexota bacterium]
MSTVSASTTPTAANGLATTQLGPLLAGPLQNLRAVETALNGRFIERGEVIRLILVALLARQHAVLVGLPGAAKTELIAQLGQLVSDGGQTLRTFTYLLTKFTTPDELFGPFSVQGLKQDRYLRLTTGRLPEAELGFLDEVFKASSSVLNSLLTVMNEREFDNDGRRQPVPLISLFGAANELPQGEDLAALWDRFALRSLVGYTSDAGFNQLLALVERRRQHQLASLVARLHGQPAAAPVVPPPPALPADDLRLLQEVVAALPLPGSVAGALEQLRKDLAAKGIVASDRRFVWAHTLIVAHALVDGRVQPEPDDLVILADALWQLPEQRQEIRRVIARLGNPLTARAVELGDQAASIHQEVSTAQRDSSLSDGAKMQAVGEAAAKLKQVAQQLQQVCDEATAQGKPTAKIERVRGQVRAMQQEVAQLILG